MAIPPVTDQGAWKGNPLEYGEQADNLASASPNATNYPLCGKQQQRIWALENIEQGLRVVLGSDSDDPAITDPDANGSILSFIKGLLSVSSSSATSGQNFKLSRLSFQTNAEPNTGIIGDTNIISQYFDGVGGGSGDMLEFTQCGTNGAVVGAKLLINGVAPTQLYKLYLFVINGGQNFNNSGINGIDFVNSKLITTISFDTLLSSGTTDTVYSATVETAAFSGLAAGTIWGVLQNADGANVTITPGTTIEILLSIISDLDS